MVENVDLIKGIFSHFNLDMRTHCKYSPPPAEDHEELEELPAEAPAEQVGEELEEPLEEIIENPKGRPPIKKCFLSGIARMRGWGEDPARIRKKHNIYIHF